jgi:hypothetical protein
VQARALAGRRGAARGAPCCRDAGRSDRRGLRPRPRPRRRRQAPGRGGEGYKQGPLGLGGALSPWHAAGPRPGRARRLKRRVSRGRQGAGRPECRQRKAGKARGKAFALGAVRGAGCTGQGARRAAQSEGAGVSQPAAPVRAARACGSAKALAPQAGGSGFDGAERCGRREGLALGQGAAPVAARVGQEGLVARGLRREGDKGLLGPRGQFQG